MPAPTAKSVLIPALGKATIVWLILLMVLASVAYSPAIRGPFVFDDIFGIQDNASIRSLTPVSAVLRPPPDEPIAGRPISNVSLAVDYAINSVLRVDQRDDPAGPDKTIAFHITNIIIHLLVGLLLFGIVRRTVILQRYSKSIRAHAAGIALACTALWMLSPIQTEAVDYLVQRTEILVSLWYLLTLYASIRAHGAADQRPRLAWLGLALIVCLFGMGSKEVMASAPLMIILYDRAFVAGSWAEVFSPAFGRIRFYVLLAATWATLVALIAGGARAGTVGLGIGMPWYVYAYSQAWAIAHYLRLVVLPFGLSFDYGVAPILGLRPIPGLLILTLFAIATIVAWFGVDRWGWFAFLGAWFFMILAPSSSVVPIITEIAAERRIYLALAAVIVLVVVAVVHLLERQARDRHAGQNPAGEQIGALRRLAPTVVTAAIAVILASITFGRSALYSHPERLYLDAISHNPANPRAYNNLASIYTKEGPAHAADAEAEFRRAIAVDSMYLQGWYGLALELMTERKFPDAIEPMHHVLALDSNYVRGVERYGDLLIQLGHPADALPYLHRAVTLAPGASLYWARLALGNALVGQRDSAEAAAQLAGMYGSNDPGTLLILGRVRLVEGRLTDAERDLTLAIRMTPDDPEVITTLADVEARIGNATLARQLYGAALTRDPTYQPARDGLAHLGGS